MKTVLENVIKMCAGTTGTFCGCKAGQIDTQFGACMQHGVRFPCVDPDIKTTPSWRHHAGRRMLSRVSRPFCSTRRWHMPHILSYPFTESSLLGIAGYRSELEKPIHHCDLPCNRSVPTQPISTRKAQSRKRSPHTFAHFVNFSDKNVSAIFDNHTILLFWL